MTGGLGSLAEVVDGLVLNGPVRPGVRASTPRAHSARPQRPEASKSSANPETVTR